MAESSTPPASPAAKTNPTTTPAPRKTTPAADRATTSGDRSAPAVTRPRPTGQDASTVGPAATAIRDAARAAEVEQLTRQRDELRELIGDAPTLEVLRAEVDALQQAAAKAGVTGTHRFTMSAGVAADLETRGYATDPASGDAFVRDGDRVTVTARSGETRTVDMPAPSGAGARPADSDK